MTKKFITTAALVVKYKDMNYAKGMRDKMWQEHSCFARFTPNDFTVEVQIIGCVMCAAKPHKNRYISKADTFTIFERYSTYRVRYNERRT